MLIEAADQELARLAACLRERRLLRCFDIRHRVETQLPSGQDEPRAAHLARIALVCARIERLLRIAPNRILTERYSRSPYKSIQDSQTPLNRILINSGSGAPRDMAELSPIIAAAEPFHVFRAYFGRDDHKALQVVENIVRTSLEGGCHVNT